MQWQCKPRENPVTLGGVSEPLASRLWWNAVEKTDKDHFQAVGYCIHLWRILNFVLGKLALAARSSSDKRFLSDISIGLTTAHDTGFISMTVSLKLDYNVNTCTLYLYTTRLPIHLTFLSRLRM